MTKHLFIFILSAFFVPVKGYAQTAPVVDFSLSATSVCPGSTIQVTDMSTGSPTTWTYTIDGATTYTTQNIAVSFTNPGVHGIDLISENASGQGAVVTKTVLVNPLPIVSTGTSGSVSYTIPTGGSTNGWAPWTTSFMDPLPANAVVSGIDLIFSGVDQGWGGTGAAASIVVAGTNIGYGIFQHTSQTFTINYSGAVPNYVYGGSNTFEMYFAGWPGWVGNWEGGVMTIHYQTNIPPAAYCSGTSVTLSAIGASTYTWSGNVTNNVPFTATSSAVYTVTGTSAAGCVNTMTQGITITPSPTVSMNTGTICAGQSFTFVPSGAQTYTFVSPNYVVTPSVSTTYTIVGADANGCVSNPTNGYVSVVQIPTVSISGGSICAGAVFTFMPSGADAYILGGTTTPTVSPATTTSYSFTGLNLPNCHSPAPTVITVTVLAVPVLTVTSSAEEICSGESAILTAAGASNYIWNTASTTNTASVHPLITKTFTVTGTAANGCSSKAVITVTVNECTGLGTIHAVSLNHSIFPNPTHGKISLSSSGKAEYAILNSLGQEVVKRTAVKHEVEEIQLEAFENGIYFIRIYEQGQIQTLRLIKQN